MGVSYATASPAAGDQHGEQLTAYALRLIEIFSGVKDVCILSEFDTRNQIALGLAGLSP